MERLIYLKPLMLAVASSALFAIHGLSYAGPYTAQKNRACPEGWEDTKVTVPVISDASAPWGDESSGDKAAGLTHITPRAQVNTIDDLPVTPQDKVDDPLTVASECLVFRNMEVDASGHVASAPVTADPSLGWIPAAIY